MPANIAYLKNGMSKTIKRIIYHEEIYHFTNACSGGIDRCGTNWN
jgi:hypothetical protein